MPLYEISVGIKTFLRDMKLFHTIASIREAIPDLTMIIADCGDPIKKGSYKDDLYNYIVEEEGHKVIRMGYDAGFGAMSNAIVDALETPYLLVASDDFNFRPPSVLDGIEKMLEVLEKTDVDIASGRLRGPYEFDLEDKGDVIIEHPVHISANPEPWFVYCDVTVNYNLIKRRVFEKVRWDNDVKIGGGEHGSFYLDAKRAGFKTAYVFGASIEELRGEDDAKYRSFRARASNPARPCFVRRGIRKYILGNGSVDWEAPDYPEPITR